jgi:hypothetical protein
MIVGGKIVRGGSMSLEQGFAKMLAGVRMADEGRDEIIAGMQQALTGKLDMETQLVDLRESIDVLRELVMEQGAELKRLREAR